jgi:hypothetical protein
MFTAPWPVYNWGMFIFVIMMGILLGIIVYASLEKAKLFGGEFGGAKGGINAALAIILTMIVIKFMPFTYYMAIVMLLVVVVAIICLWTIMGMMSKLGGGTESKIGKGTTIGAAGVSLFVLAYVMTGMMDQFKTWGVAYTDFWGATNVLGFVMGAFGVVMIVISAYYVISGATAGLGGGLGGGGLGGSVRKTLGMEEAQGEDLFKLAKDERYWATKQREFTSDLRLRLRKVAQLISAHSLPDAEKELKKISIEFNEKLADYEKIQNAATKQLDEVHEMEKEERAKIGRPKIEKAEEGVEKLADFVKRMGAHAKALSININDGLHKVIQLCKKGELAEAEVMMQEIISHFAEIESEDNKLRGVVDEMWRIVSALTDGGWIRRAPAPGAPPGVPPGAPPAPAGPPGGGGIRPLTP